MKSIFSIYWFSAVVLSLLISCSSSEKPATPEKLNTIEILFEYDMLTAIGQMALEEHKDKDYETIIGLAAEMAKTDTSTNAADLVYAAYQKVKPKGKDLNYYFGTGKPETDTLFNDSNTLVFIKNHIRKEFNSMADVILEMLSKYRITNISKVWIPPGYFKVVFDSPVSKDTIKNFTLSGRGSLLAFYPVLNETWVVEMFRKLDKVLPGLTEKDKEFRELFESHTAKITGKSKDNPQSGIDYIGKYPFTHMFMVYINDESGKPVGVSLEQYGFPKTGNTSYYTIFTDTSNLDFYYMAMNHPEISKLYNDKYRFINTSGRFATENNGASEIFAVAKEPALTDKNVTEAMATMDESKIPIVLLNFDSTGARIFEEITKKSIKKRIAISVGGTVYSAPIVQSVITGGTASITGLKDLDEASRLVAMLKSGTEKWPIKIISIK